MATYYVAPSGGTDGAGNTGAIGDPFATLAYALNTRAAAGDTILLNDGVHNVAAGHVLSEQPASTITIAAVNAGAASLTSDSGAGGYVVNLNTCKNLTFSGIVFTGGTAQWTVFLNSAGVENLIFTNCTFTNGAASGKAFAVLSKTVAGLTFTSCTFTCTGAAIGFYGNGAAATSATDWTFTNCTFSTAATGLQIEEYVTNITITGGTFESTAAASVGIDIYSGSCTNVVLTGVATTGVLYGLRVGGATTSTVTGLTISNCTCEATGATGGTAPCGILLANVTNGVITDTQSTGTDYGILAVGKIAGLSISDSVFTCETALGAYLGGASTTSPMSGNITVTDVVAESVAADGKGFALGEALVGATVVITRLIARNHDGNIACRLGPNTATVTYAWGATTTVDMSDSFIEGNLIIGTAHSHMTIRSCVVTVPNETAALVVRRGIAGATVRIYDCIFTNAGVTASTYLVLFAGTRDCTITKCQFVSHGVAGWVFYTTVNDTGETVEGFTIQSCWIYVPTGGRLYEFPSASLSATPAIKINGSHIFMPSKTANLGKLFGTANIATLADLRTAWDTNAGTAGNDLSSELAARKGQFGTRKKIVRLL
jgi:hypothetical protein